MKPSGYFIIRERALKIKSIILFSVLMSFVFSGFIQARRRMTRKLRRASRSRRKRGPTPKYFVLLVEGRNNKDSIQENLDSIFTQVYEDYDVIIVDDCSDDGTDVLIQDYIAQKNVGNKIRKIMFNKEQRGKRANIYDVIHKYCKNTEIIVELAASDWFLDDKVLFNLNKIYANPNMWLTYGNYLYQPYGKVADVAKEIPIDLVKEKKMREQAWSYSGLTTYHAGLFKLIKKEHLLHSQLPTSILLPMLEMCRDNHFKFITGFHVICKRYLQDCSKKYTDTAELLKDVPEHNSLCFPIWDMRLILNKFFPRISIKKKREKGLS